MFNNEQLTEDIWQFKLPDGSLLDIGWYPDSDPNGAFTCFHISKEDPEAWGKPLSEIRTRILSEVFTWIVERTTTK